MNKNYLKKSVLAAMLLAVGMLLPFITAHIPQVGRMLLPMHIPVLLCGFLCGPLYGGTIGLILPLFRSAVFGFPELYYEAVVMTFELCTYGFVSGIMYKSFKNKNLKAIYFSLITAMILGRSVWGIVMAILLGVGENRFTINVFVGLEYITALPGIILQLIIIPVIVVLLSKYNIVTADNKNET